MALIRVKLTPGAVPKLMKSPEMQRGLLASAKKMAAAAGPGVEADVSVGRTRARAVARTATLEAIIDEARNRSLTRAIDAGR